MTHLLVCFTHIFRVALSFRVNTPTKYPRKDRNEGWLPVTCVNVAISVSSKKSRWSAHLFLCPLSSLEKDQGSVCWRSWRGAAQYPLNSTTKLGLLSAVKVTLFFRDEGSKPSTSTRPIRGPLFVDSGIDGISDEALSL